MLESSGLKKLQPIIRQAIRQRDIGENADFLEEPFDWTEIRETFTSPELKLVKENSIVFETDPENSITNEVAENSKDTEAQGNSKDTKVTENSKEI